MKLLSVTKLARDYLSKQWTNLEQQNSGAKIAELLASNGADLSHETSYGDTLCEFADGNGDD